MAPEIPSATTADGAATPTIAAPGKWQSFLLPTIAEWAFVAVLGWLFFGAAGAQTLLADGDAGWHIRTGEYALDNLSLPPTVFASS